MADPTPAGHRWALVLITRWERVDSVRPSGLGKHTLGVRVGSTAHHPSMVSLGVFVPVHVAVLTECTSPWVSDLQGVRPALLSQGSHSLAAGAPHPLQGLMSSPGQSSASPHGHADTSGPLDAERCRSGPTWPRAVPSASSLLGPRCWHQPIRPIRPIQALPSLQHRPCWHTFRGQTTPAGAG